jgi:hypothetical protein
MKSSPVIFWFTVFIALATMASGGLQVLCPSFVLGLVGGETGPTANHFFGIIGMFMVLFGGLLFQGLTQENPVALFWAAGQKVGAALAVGLGVFHHLFSMPAMAVAGFDLLSGILIIWLWFKCISGAR